MSILELSTYVIYQVISFSLLFLFFFANEAISYFFSLSFNLHLCVCFKKGKYVTRNIENTVCWCRESKTRQQLIISTLSIKRKWRKNKMNDSYYVSLPSKGYRSQWATTYSFKQMNDVTINIIVLYNYPT